MRILVAGAEYEAGNPWRLLPEIEAAPRAFVLFCEGERRLCTIPSPCDCCANIGRSFSGSKRIRSTRPHDRLPYADVIAALRGVAA